jgi:hypothetical protein
MATFTAQITLANYDGALTPSGTGTYASVDWFAQGVWIYARTDIGAGTTDTLVAAGIVDTFDLVDDGEYSTATFGVVDSWTIAARQQPQTQGVFLDQGMQGFFGNQASLLTWPVLTTTPGATGTYNYNVLTSGGEAPRLVGSATAVTGLTFSELVNQMLLPVNSGILWPADITWTGADTMHYANLISWAVTRKDVGAVTFVFDPVGSIAGTDLPFTDVQQGWTTDLLTNSATATNLTATPTEAYWVQIPSITTYGTRAVAWGNVASVNVWDTFNVAADFPNRFNLSRFTPRTVTVTAEAVTANAADAALARWQALLSVNTGLWQKANITWKGAGQTASQTAECVITGRRISATPGSTTMELFLANWTDNHSFLLNTDKLNTHHLA